MSTTIPASPPSQFFAMGGALLTTSPSYCVRKADQDLYEGLIQGDFCYILSTRQIGKTSLIARTAQRLWEDSSRDPSNGVEVIFFDMSARCGASTREQWYYGILRHIADELDLEREIREQWNTDSELPPVQRWINGLRTALLTRPNRRLFIFFDEIDYVRSLPFEASEFFVALRACYNRRIVDREFGYLTFCLLGVATPTDLISDVRLTPFNIGRRIDLTDFTFEEAQSLVKGLPCDPDSGQTLLQRVLHWTGGHPYLTQRLCHEIAQHPHTRTEAEVDKLCSELFLSPAAQERDSNLTFVRDRLLKSDVDRATLLSMYGNIRNGQAISRNQADHTLDVLLLSGLIRIDGGVLTVRNRIYDQVFDRVWMREQMPDAEKRRQTVAFWNAVIRVGAVALLVVAIIMSLAITALQQARRAVEAERGTRKLLYAVDMNVAQQALQDNNIVRAQELLDAYHSKPGSRSAQQEDLRSFEWRYFWRLCHGEQVTLRGHSGIVRMVIFSPNGKMVASCGDDNTVRLWDLATHESRVLRGHTGYVFSIAFSADGRLLASGSRDATVKLWEVSTGRLLTTFTEHKKQVNSVAISSTGILASSSDDGTIQFRNIQTLRNTGTIKLKECLFATIVFTPDSKTLVSVGVIAANSTRQQETIQLWDVPTRRLRRTILHHKIAALACSHNGKLIAVGDEFGGIEVLNTETLLRDPKPHGWVPPEHPTFMVSTLAFSPDDSKLGSASWDGRLNIWNVGTSQPPIRLRGHSGIVDSIAFAPHGTRVASSGNDSTVKLWDVSSGHIQAYQDMIPLNHHNESLGGLKFTQDSRILQISGAGDRTSKQGQTLFWDMQNWKFREILPPDLDSASSVFASGGGVIVAIHDVSKDGAVNQQYQTDVWDVGRVVRLRSRWWGDIQPRVMTEDGTRLAGVTGDSVLIWDMSSLPSAHMWPRENTGCVTIAFSPDGKLLAEGQSDGIVELRDTASGKIEIPVGEPHNDVSALAFSYDGKILAIGHWDQIITIWDLKHKTKIATLKGHTNAIRCLAFSQDGKTLASGSDDKTLRLWNIATQQEMATFRFVSSTRTVTFSPDGNLLAVGLTNGNVYVLQAASQHEVAEYEARSIW